MAPLSSLITRRQYRVESGLWLRRWNMHQARSLAMKGTRTNWSHLYPITLSEIPKHRFQNLGKMYIFLYRYCSFLNINLNKKLHEIWIIDTERVYMKRGLLDSIILFRTCLMYSLLYITMLAIILAMILNEIRCYCCIYPITYTQTAARRHCIRRM